MTRKLRRSYPSAAGFGLLLILVLADRAGAATFNATTLANSGPGSLRQAVLDANAAAGADTVLFAVTGTITLTSGEIAITDDLVIRGPGAGALKVSGNDHSRIFNIDNGDGRTINVTLSGLTLTHGFNPFDGGAVRAEHGNLTILSSVISNGAAGFGGGLSLNPANATIRFSSILGNRARLFGGGIYSNSGILTVDASTIAGNSSEFDGGGLYTEEDRDVEIVNSTISGNAATNSGGGIAYSLGMLPGGGPTGNSLHVRYTTFANNTGAECGNFCGGGEGLAEVDHSIIANGGSPSAGFGFRASYTLTNDHYHLIGDNNLVGANPLLGPLADNGGPTLTHALLPGSPAINAGNPASQNPPATDQRGFVRIFGPAADLGAVEAQPLGILEVPTLSQIGALLLSALLVAAGMWRLRLGAWRAGS
jgi:hypothetical protein